MVGKRLPTFTVQKFFVCLIRSAAVASATARTQLTIKSGSAVPMPVRLHGCMDHLAVTSGTFGWLETWWAASHPCFPLLHQRKCKNEWMERYLPLLFLLRFYLPPCADAILMDFFRQWQRHQKQQHQQNQYVRLNPPDKYLQHFTQIHIW